MAAGAVDSFLVANHLPSSYVSPISNPSVVYKEIQHLRALGQIDLAISKGEAYLKTYPKDADVMLLVGLMLYQKNKWSAADHYLTDVLTISPDYLDAKLGLINVKLAEKNFPEAAVLIAEAVQQAPNDPRVKAIEVSFEKMADQQTTENKSKPVSVVSAISVIQKKSLLTRDPSPLKKIQRLRTEGKLDEAIWVGTGYLKTHPKDTDVMLQVGLILSQQKKYARAENYLHRVLAISPNYVDATFGLIGIAIAQNHRKKAVLLIKGIQKIAPTDPRIHAAQLSLNKQDEQNKRDTLDKLYKNGDATQAKTLALYYLRQNPRDIDTRLMLGRIYLMQKQYQEAQTQFQSILRQDPGNKMARLALINTALSSGRDNQARLQIQQALAIDPTDPDFLNQEAAFYSLRHQYSRAIYLDKKIIDRYPKNKPAKALLDEITTINPNFFYGLNQLGVNSEVDYVSDLRSVWQYTTLYYNRDTPWGLASASMNDATRLGVTSNQGAINVFPIINKNLYIRFSGAYANQPILFPHYFAGIEPYFVARPVELSLGANYAYILPNIAYTQYTASITKEWGNYLATFRPNYYSPARWNSSTLYTGTFIRYLGAKDTLLKVTVGTGTMPDLANLTTIDFIVVKNNFVTFNVQYPLLNHQLLFTLGGDYQHWVFPNSRVRQISGVIVGLNYRFQGLDS